MKVQMYDLVVIGNPTFYNGRLNGPSIYTAATAAKLDIEQMAIVSAVDPKLKDPYIKGIDALDIPEYFIVETKDHSAREIQTPSFKNNEHFIGIPDKISIRDIPNEFLDAQVILLSPSLQEIHEEFVEWICNSTDALVYLDPQLRRLNSSGMLEFIREFSLTEKTQSYLDMIVPNQLESELITGESDPYLAAELIVEWASEACVITLGDEGSLVYDGTDFIKIPAFKTESVDTHGAGAVYLAAFASQSIAGTPLVDSCVYASCVASLKVENQYLDFPIDKSEIRRRTNEIASSVQSR